MERLWWTRCTTGDERSIKVSDTVRAAFCIKLIQEIVAIETIGLAYRFITRLSTRADWSFGSLNDDAKAA